MINLNGCLFYLTVSLNNCHTEFTFLTFKMLSLQAEVLIEQAHTQGEEGGGQGGCDRTSLAGHIISKSCSFSPETEFTPLIFVLQIEIFLKVRTSPLCKLPGIRTHFLKSLRMCL